MNKREKEVLEETLKNEKKVLKELDKVYAEALTEIDDKILQLLARDDGNMQNVIYQVEYQKALKQQIESAIDTLHSKEFTSVSEYLTDCYNTGFIGTMYNLHGQNIPLMIPIDQEQVVQAITKDTKLSESLYNRLGKDIKTLKKQIASELSVGIATAQSYADIHRNIATVAGINKNKAMRIARTEGHRIQQTAAVNACNKAVEKGADIVKQWSAALDGRTRDSHRRVDGEIVELDKPFSNGLMYPGDPNGPAAEVVNCRCTISQRAKWRLDNEELERLKVRAGYFGLDKTENFTDYKSKYLEMSEEDLLTAGSSGKMVLKSGLKKITGNHTIEDDIGTRDNPTCNPNYKKKGDYAKNCGYCSATYEMRRRGYDVIANPLNTMLVSDWVKLFDNADVRKFIPLRRPIRKGETDEKLTTELETIPSTVEQLSSQLLSLHEDGARGSVFVQWVGRQVGHFFSWEIEGDNVCYIDGQNGNMNASEYFNHVEVNSILTIRWDNLMPSDSIKEACKDRG